MNPLKSGARIGALMLLQLVGSAASLIPLLAVIELGRILLAPGPVEPGRVEPVMIFGAAGLLVRLVFTGAATALGHRIDSTMQLALRRRLASRLGKVPLAWLLRRRSGELSTIVGDDVSALHPAIAHAPAQLVDAFAVPAVSLIYLLSVDGWMTLITLIPVFVAIAMVPLMMTPTKAAAERDFDAAMGRLRTSLVELVRGIRVVKMFAGPERTGLGFRQAATEFVSTFRRWVRAMAGPAAAMQLALSPPVMVLTVLVGGAVLIDAGRLTPVDLLPFLLLGLGLAAPVAALGHGFDDLQAARRALGRIRDVLAVAPLPMPAESAVPDGSRVELRDVSFAYEGHPVLDGIDLTLEPGTTTALVGRSGSGKSTLAQLILRFADPARGAVTLGGVDLRDLDAETLNNSVVAVLQDAEVLRATIAENIAVAVPHATEEQIMDAARLANIHDRILALPRGYQSVVGEDAQLSGGERQRIALARAFLSPAPVLILDEATSSADPLTERAIRDALAATASGRSTLVIAHRLETVAHADRVVVLDEGRIVEDGPAESLLASGGVFAELRRASASVVREGDDDR